MSGASIWLDAAAGSDQAHWIAMIAESVITADWVFNIDLPLRFEGVASFVPPLLKEAGEPVTAVVNGKFQPRVHVKAFTGP
jgi:hypothetical protein